MQVAAAELTINPVLVRSTLLRPSAVADDAEPPLDGSALDGDLSRTTFRPAQHYSLVLQQQGRVATDADWNEQQHLHRYRTEAEAFDVIGPAGAPADGGGFGIALTADGSDLTIAAGRIYVGGMMCENGAGASYLHQPFLPQPAPLDLAHDTYLVYLEVWRRHLTALDDPHIREVALNGPDTATREQIAWQVRALPVDLGTLSDPSKLSCGTELDAWAQLIAQSSGRLNARTRPPAPTDDACILPPTAGYQRLENQLYRVQIHAAGALGDGAATAPTYVWSRDNASVVAPVVTITGTDVTLTTLGHDDDTGFVSAPMVELIDDARVFDRVPGPIAKVVGVDAGARKLTLDQSFPAVDPSLHPRLRRWDGTGTATVAKDDASWVPLEAGVEVTFTAGTYANGDYWQIPARTAVGDIEWPPYGPPGTPPVAQPRFGVVHRFCRLALVRPVDGKPAVSDCRPTFDPLTRPATHVVSTGWRNDDFVDTASFFAQGLALAFDAPELVLADASVRVFADLPFGTIVQPAAAAEAAPAPAFPLEEARLLAEPAATATVGTPAVTAAVATPPAALSAAAVGLAPIVVPPPAPVPIENRFPLQAIELPGTISVDGATPPVEIPADGARTFPSSRLRWTPSPLVARLLEPYLQNGLRCRVLLKGETIFSLDGTVRAYLDGTARTLVGKRQSGSDCTAQIFPSGIGRRASDFESWFFLQRAAPPLRVTHLQFQTARGVSTLDVADPLAHANPVIPFEAATAQVLITFSIAPSTNGFGAGGPRAVVLTSAGKAVAVTASLAGAVATVGFMLPTGAPGIESGSYVLQVLGKGDGAATVAATSSADGTPLDGTGTGTPGTDFTFTFSIAPRVVVPPPPPQQPR
jgi:hypothetical protein